MTLDPSLLSQLLGPHPARAMPFEDLRAGLLHRASEKLINVSRDGNLELFSYSSNCQFEQKWDIYSLIARGLILDSQEKRVVATPFPKFFNFNEGGIPLPAEPFEVSEKIDGSLGIVFFHQGNWRVTTRGQLRSDQGAWATSYLHQHVAMQHLAPDTTYLVEIIYPENQVVIPYDFSGLVLLGAYDGHGHELNRPALVDVAGRAGLRIAPVVACGSFDRLLEVAKSLTRHEEGFVIRFQNGLRIKLKGEAYCRVHKLISRCTPLALWESMMNSEELESMRRELPEEMLRDFDSIRRLLLERVDAVLAEVRAGNERLAGISDKELGLLRQDPDSGLTDLQKKFVFACRKQNFLEAVHQKGEWREKMFKQFRPDHNRLPGYVPSDVMTRFAEDEG